MTILEVFKNKTIAIGLFIVLIGGASLLATTLGFEGAGGVILVGVAFLLWRGYTG